VSGQRHSVIGTPPADSNETNSSGLGAAMAVCRAVKKRLLPMRSGGGSGTRKDAAAKKANRNSSAQRSEEGGRATRRQAPLRGAAAGAVTRAALGTGAWRICARPTMTSSLSDTSSAL
jgi:hypothetical protein